MSREKVNSVEFSPESLRVYAKEAYGSLKGLAEAMGISSQHLQAYLNGNREWGASFREKLTSVGFMKPTQSEIKQCLNKVDEPPKQVEQNALTIDINGIVELTRTQLPRLAQIMGVSHTVLKEWGDGKSQPTYPQLAQLLNLTIAMGLAVRDAANQAPRQTSHSEDYPHKAVS